MLPEAPLVAPLPVEALPVEAPLPLVLPLEAVAPALEPELLPLAEALRPELPLLAVLALPEPLELLRPLLPEALALLPVEAVLLPVAVLELVADAEALAVVPLAAPPEVEPEVLPSSPPKQLPQPESNTNPTTVDALKCPIASPWMPGLWAKRVAGPWHAVHRALRPPGRVLAGPVDARYPLRLFLGAAMNTAVKVVGIGCAVLGLLGIGGVVIAGVVAKKVVDEVAPSGMAGITQAAAEMGKTEEALKALDTKYPWKAPSRGQPMALTEAQLTRWIAVRGSVKPVFDKWEAQTQAFKGKYEGKENEGALKGLKGAMEGTRLVTELLQKTREAFATGLEAQKMSPREYGAVAAMVLGASRVAEGAGPKRAEIDAQLAAAREQLGKSKDDAEKAGLEAQIQGLEHARKMVPDEARLKVLTANAAVIAPHRAEVDKLGSEGLDGLLLGTDGMQSMIDQLGAELGPTDDGAAGGSTGDSK